MPGSDSDPNSASDLTPDQRRVLEDLYQRLVEWGRWPTFLELDHDLDRHGIENPLELMRTLCPHYLEGVGPAGPPSQAGQLSLSLAGLAATATWNEQARADLELYAKSVEHAVAISDATRPPDVAEFDPLPFARPHYLGEPDSADMVRLGELWHSAGSGLWGRIGGLGTAEWCATLDQPRLRSYRQVHDVDSLLRASEAVTAQGERQRLRQFADHPNPLATSAPSPTATAPAWATLLPDGFRDAVVHLIAEHRSEAINAGWIALAELIHRKIALDLDGEDLINQSFGGRSPRLRLDDNTKTGDNLHEGYTSLMRGLVRLRNAQSHRGRREVSELHLAASILAMADCYVVVSALTDAESPAADAEAPTQLRRHHD